MNRCGSYILLTCSLQTLFQGVKKNHNRGVTDWTIAVLISIALNIVLFGLMPTLIRMAPQKQNIKTTFKPLQIIRVHPRQMPPERKEMKKHSPATKEKINRKNLIKVFQQKNQVLKPKMFFGKNPKFSLNSALNSDNPGPGKMPVINFTMTGPVLKDKYRIEELDTPVIPIVKIPPLYPAVAMRNNIEGWVKIRFIITDRGVVKNIHIIKAIPGKIFNTSVINCVSKWRFKPGKVGGVPVNTMVETSIRFKLSNE